MAAAQSVERSSRDKLSTTFARDTAELKRASGMDDAEAGAEVPDFHVRRHAGIMNVIRGCRLIQRSQRELLYRQLHCEA